MPMDRTCTPPTSLACAAPDGHPPLPPADPLIESEGAIAGRVNGDLKPAHVGVENLVVPPQVLGLPDSFIIFSLLTMARTHLLVPT